VAFAELQGSELELDELDAARYRAWGRALALVHRASRTFPLHPERSNWLDELRALLSTLPPNETALAQVLNSGIVWLESFAPPERDYGLIHGDFELDNLIWDGDHFQALDFDDATYAWYAVDFAAALQDVWLAGSEQRDERIQWFLEGYAALRPLPEGLHAALPPLMTLQDAIKMARLLRAYASTTDDNAPAWAGSMRTRHQQWLEAKRKTLVWA
jgi:Ser/Thr protein kinase RdoA (MazF antagonist)